MNIIAHNAVSKLAVVFVAAAMLLTVATPAKAQTIQELQALIAQLQAQITALIGGSGTVSASACTFTRSLTIGSQGADVTCLQTYLTATGHFSFAGGATGYFGPITRSAVAAWQAANGVAPAVGYFGPISQAKYAMLTANAGGGTGDDDDDDDTPSGLQGGAGSIKNADFLAGLNNEEVGEDEEDVEVAGLVIEADKGSDIEITAVALDFDKGASGNRDFHKYASEVSIWLEGEEYARIDADEFEDDDEYGTTISLDRGAIIRAGDEGELVVAVSAVSNLDSGDEGDTWDVGFTEVRFRDASGAVITDSSTDNIGDSNDTTTVGTDERQFSFESFSSAADIEVKISKGDEDVNDARTIQVNTSSKTNDVSILSFEVEVEGDSDVTIDDLVVEFVTARTAATIYLDDLASGVDLLMDGDVVGSENPGADENTVTFDDMNLTLEAGETYEFLVNVDLLSTSGALNEGDTILAKVTSAERALWDVEDENGDGLTDGTEVTGTATSETHVVYATAFEFTMVSIASSKSAGDGSSGSSDVGTYTTVFDLTAFGGDVWVDKTCAEDEDQGDNGEGTSYIVTNPTNNTSNCSFSSTASTDTSSWIVSEGETKRFTLTVAVTATSSDFARTYLEAINWDSTATATPSKFFTTGLGSENTATDELYLRKY